MQIVVKASREQKATLESIQWADNLHWHWIEEGNFVKDADAYFDLCFEEEGWFFEEITSAPVFVNAVVTTSAQLPMNAVRINAWNSFLNRPVWEVVFASDQWKERTIELLDAMGRKTILVPDEPGLIAARVIAMIINEAFFALGEDISSKTEIDIAMKLGTNYPFGPFDWADLIGLDQIAQLLDACYLKDERYAIAPALRRELDSPIKSNRT